MLGSIGMHMNFKNYKFNVFIVLLVIIFLGSKTNDNPYVDLYTSSIENFKEEQIELLTRLDKLNLSNNNNKSVLLEKIYQLRITLKKIDLWLRYFDPIQYKKINGPLNIEWEIEVFEKFEKPYKRIGSGLSLIENELNKDSVKFKNIENLLVSSIVATKSYLSDSIKEEVAVPDHFILANRLFLLNLSALYTTGFECPNRSRVLIELEEMLLNTRDIYFVFNKAYPDYNIDKEYLDIFDKTIAYVAENKNDYDRFNHLVFIKDFINPLFSLNQSYIRKYKAKSISYNEFTLNNEVSSIFSKSLFAGQDMLGVYRSVSDKKTMDQIVEMGRQFFNEPLFSGNNKRSCASCHKLNNYFTDTTTSTAIQFNMISKLERNAPSLINVEFNHLLMQDGKHFSIFNQMKDVSLNPIELNSNENEILKKILSCKEYKTKLKRFAQLSTEKKISFKHLSSALSCYLSSYSKYNSKFDRIMNKEEAPNYEIEAGFNLFMGKAQCGTCHFVPLFNGVKPPFINSEFEVLGIPSDTTFQMLSLDKGRWKVLEAPETQSAFRTSALRNVLHTKPFMHNGVFFTIGEVLDFYNEGGGKGKGLKLVNQTLSESKLDLSKNELNLLTLFLESLSEDIIFDTSEFELAKSKKASLNSRLKGGEY
ncbi:MAG: cytochrome c peroxidase [Saprospiraceae bacterium]